MNDDSQVVLRFAADGIEPVKAGLNGLQNSVQALVKTTQDATKGQMSLFGGFTAEVAKATPQLDLFSKQITTVASTVQTQSRSLGDAMRGMLAGFTQAFSAEKLKESFGSFKVHAAELKHHFEQGEAAAQGMSGGLGVLRTAFAALTSPLGLVLGGFAAAAVAVGGFIALAEKAAASAISLAVSLRQLSSTSGLSAHDSDVLAKTFELAGVEGDRLNMALFRLSGQIEMGGEELAKYGIKIHDTFGRLKEPAEVLLELRSFVSGMEDAQQRLAVLRQQFGRQGSIMTAVFSMPEEKFQHLMDIARQNSAMTQELYDRSIHLSIAQAELSQKWQQLNLNFAKTVGIPVAEWFEHVKMGAVDLALWMQNHSKGLSAWLTDIALHGFMRARSLREHQAEQQKMAEEEAEKSKKASPLSPAAIQLEQQKIRLSYETQIKLAEGEMRYQGEIRKIQTDSEMGSLELQKNFVRQQIGLIHQRYDEEVAIAKKAAGPELGPQEKFRLEKERDDALIPLRNQARMLDIQMYKAGIDDLRKSTEDKLLLIKSAEEDKLAILRLGHEQERALIREADLTQTAEARATQQSEEANARNTAAVRIESINRQIEVQMRLRAQTSGQDFATQQEISRKILELQKAREDAEVNANTAIIQSREQMVAKMKALADEEIGIGRSLEDQAKASLQKRGVTAASQADIRNEVARLRQRSQETLGQYDAGGRVTFERLDEARGFSDVAKRMNNFGDTNTFHALFASVRDALAAVFGQRPGVPGKFRSGPGGELLPVESPTEKLAPRPGEAGAGATIVSSSVGPALAVYIANRAEGTPGGDGTKPVGANGAEGTPGSEGSKPAGPNPGQTRWDTNNRGNAGPGATPYYDNGNWRTRGHDSAAPDTGADKIAAAYEESLSKAEAAVDAFSDRVANKLRAANQQIVENFENLVNDTLVRVLEFQGARA